MRLCFRIVDAACSQVMPVDVVVDAPAASTVAMLRAPLAEALGWTGAHELRCHGRSLRDEDHLGAPPLLHGAVLTARRLGEGAAAQGADTPRTAGTRRRASRAAAELPRGGAVRLSVVGGVDAGRQIRVGRGEHVIGRAASSGVRVDDPDVSRAHAVLTVEADGVHVRDLGPTNHPTLNGVPLPSEGASLRRGDRLRVGSTLLALGEDPERPGRMSIEGGRVAFHRRPRLVPPTVAREVTFPEEPRRPDSGRAPVLAAVLPLGVSAVLAWAMDSPALLLFALLSPVMLLGQWWGDRRAGRVSYRRQVREHRDALAVARASVAEQAAADERERRTYHPDLGRLLDVVEGRGHSLWQRRPSDPDHLALRLGVADRPAGVACRGTTEAVPTLDAVPVWVDLRATPVVGLSGPRPDRLASCGAIVAQLVAWHTPRDVRLHVLGDSVSAPDDWDWCCLLPHAAGPREDERSAAHAAALSAGGLSDLVAELDRRRGAEPRAVDTVVGLDGASTLRAVPGVAELLRDGPQHGMAFLCLDSCVESLPAEASAVVVLEGSGAAASLRLSAGTVQGVLPDLPGRGWLERLARAAAPLVDATPDSASAALPTAVSFRSLHLEDGHDPTNHDGVLAAWAVRAGRPVALLGRAADGPCVVDLASMGPHALIGGTTGSGKSELLQTLVAGLAVSARPDELAFILVDYKGGSAFAECARLPHTVGVVTDLDDALTKRALTSLRAELRRRERLLAETGAKDFDEYRRRRDAAPGLEPLARLVLVVDEFKVLADELPDFVDGLVRLAAVGRSLGVHLVLATQRPGGIVSADMRANVSARISLRVRDRSDSSDVIDAPDAAAIPDKVPGRAYLRAGDQRLVAFQTAYVGGGHTEGPREPETVRVRVVGAPAAPKSAESGSAENTHPAPPARTELAAVVDATTGAARVLGVEAPRSPWLPPLPDVVTSHDLAEALGPENQGGQHGAADPRLRLGLVDRPDEQRREVWTWDLERDGHLGIAGGSRSGRSTALALIATELAAAHPPGAVHLHVIEGVPGPLRRLECLPHVGSATGSDDPHLARRAIARLTEQLDAPPGQRRTVVLVDGWEALEDALTDIEHGGALDDLHRIVRDGPARNITLAVTGGRGILSGRVSGLLPRRLVLQMPDPLDLTLAGVDPVLGRRARPPGRAIDPTTGHEVQLASPRGTDPGAPLAEALRTASEHAMRRAAAASSDPAATSDLPWTVRELPGAVRLTDLPTLPGHLVLGVGGDDASPVVVRPDQARGRMLVAGPPRSGRSTLLASLATQLLHDRRHVVLVAPLRSHARSLLETSGATILGTDEPDAFVAVRSSDPDLCVLVDDAEQLDGTRLGEAVLEAAALVDRTDGFFVAAVDLARACAAFRGLIPELARDGHGIVLSAQSPTDGEVLGVRLAGHLERRPGRGHHVIGGRATPLQTALAGADDLAGAAGAR
jgi:S-DNA-T family DNA segregation ATPase FtsK/SpoIIIE